jgi:hypothetical protein
MAAENERASENSVKNEAKNEEKSAKMNGGSGVNGVMKAKIMAISWRQ